MLSIPAPLPDELSRSFLGRLMRMNGIVSEKSMTQALAISLSVSRRQVSATRLMSKVAGIEVERFVCLHTLIPLRNSISSRYTFPHGAAGREGILFRGGLSLLRQNPYFCPDCIRTDLDRYGMSYWHREHQLPGAFVCARHRVPLKCVDGAPSLLRPPSQCLAMDRGAKGRWPGDVHEQESVQRFLAICDGLIDSRAPYSVPLVSECLRERAKTRGLMIYPRTQLSTRARLLSDVVLEVFPRDWLSEVFPELIAKPRGVVLPNLDGVLSASSSSSFLVTSFVLACSVLYSSADEALADLALQQETECGTQTPSRRRTYLPPAPLAKEMEKNSRSPEEAQGLRRCES